ncbi:TlpA family protein disulfide reductase [Fulvivirgaceae bacterium PWU5]|uniref:TlpA family protein disulfide reductase n=1 Tax=Dawidia cretensis TaxID=2782350 RepID=A0AAP2E5N6_9BACT|nr:TlpA disulfide reductase family protein [Dawidia cretensis]MBT1712372.1 TlpA family protein disulfide reductase [Dawidia cretensis]
MPKYLIAIVLFLLTLTLHAQTRPFTIAGKLQGNYTGTITLHYTLNTQEPITLQTPVENKTFHFIGQVPHPVQATLELEGLSTAIWLYLDSGSIHVNARTHTFIDPEGRLVNRLQSTSITGSYSEMLKSDFFTFWRTLIETDQPDSAKAETLYRHMLALVDAQPASNIGSELLRDADLLTYAQADTIFHHLSAEQQSLAGSNGVAKLLQRLAHTERGTPFKFFLLTDKTGKPMSGEQLPHKYMLVDFWASWCGPCRREHPNLVSLYSKYHSAGFEIVSISLDEERPRWLSAIANDELTWPQLSDLKGMTSPAAQYYALSFIPFNVLLDAHGKIIAKDVKGERLQKLLASLLPE